ncbi:MAG: nicotinate (nicotinamide) nucleotide adenylyltransferase [Nitrospirae bacterium RIFCSPLOWO2_02_FULL_62_14]|nr:MAG: nicotinate (nicotinamide) nucleotide adenylyltransferase [Nitrospirae bacterium RIFCSPLOWO2_02_FULL_62_14]OGW68940.1 MAG: nicotinate (nicotinamide) nucleotide adenylyltransferase [Nitrospirae bacterium RIFCSPLOWO2_01_FULL_62_17]
MRIGLFGGTFNPIHNCHLTIAAQIRERLSLDQILFIPTGDPPHKPHDGLAPASHRLEMVRLAVAADSAFAVADIEIRRQAKSYSIDTVRALRDHYGSEADLSFILGLDAFLEFPGWRQAPDLLRLCHFIVVSRTGASFAPLADHPPLPPIPHQALESLDRRTQDRLDVPVPGGTRLTLIRLPPCDITASDIRRRIRSRMSVASLLPAPVESYIMRTRLYQEEPYRPGIQG